MTQPQIYMLEGSCIGIAVMIIVMWILMEKYGIRSKKRGIVQESN